MNVLDLFSGIGGFSLGLERAGMRTVAFCEINEHCRSVLQRHWPSVPIYDDIRTLSGDCLGDIRIDVICGGFPCQDISFAGAGAGLKGERSGLWADYARLIGELRPSFVIVENVSALLGRGLGDVLGDLAALRYDAEWHCIPAAYVGAPHLRDRVWIIAYAQEKRPVAWMEGVCAQELSRELRGIFGRDWPAWLDQSEICRMDDRPSDWMDRNESLGNTVVPQIPEIIGRAIMTASTLSSPD